MLNKLDKQELIKLVRAYDKYIFGIVEDLPLESVGRVPVSVSEFYHNDFELYKAEGLI